MTITYLLFKILAAVETGRDLAYFTFGEVRLRDNIADCYEAIKTQTVGEIYMRLCNYSRLSREQRRHCGVFDFLLGRETRLYSRPPERHEAAYDAMTDDEDEDHDAGQTSAQFCRDQNDERMNKPLRRTSESLQREENDGDVEMGDVEDKGERSSPVGGEMEKIKDEAILDRAEKAKQALDAAEARKAQIAEAECSPSDAKAFGGQRKNTDFCKPVSKH